MQVWSEALIGLNRVENKKESATREGSRVNFQIDGNWFFFFFEVVLTVSARLFDMVCEADSMFLSHIAANI